LYLLLATRFPNSVVVESVVVSVTACCAKYLDWRVAAKIVTYRGVGWAIDLFVLYKCPSTDGIFPAVFEEGREDLIPYLLKMFRACLVT